MPDHRIREGVPALLRRSRFLRVFHLQRPGGSLCSSHAHVSLASLRWIADGECFSLTSALRWLSAGEEWKLGQVSMASQLLGCVISDKWLSLAGPHFPHT